MKLFKTQYSETTKYLIEKILTDTVIYRNVKYYCANNYTTHHNTAKLSGTKVPKLLSKEKQHNNSEITRTDAVRQTDDFKYKPKISSPSR